MSFTRLKFCNFKLDSLLEITKAINANLSTDALLKRYEELLKERLNIGKILLYGFNKRWEVIIESGIESKAYNINVDSDLLHHTDITTTTSTDNKHLQDFDIIIPVFNNNSPLAFVLIGDIDEEKEGVSPTIKHLLFIQTLTNIIIVAIENRRLQTEMLRQEAIKKELELASKMQSMLIPSPETFPNNEKIQVRAFYFPHLEVGGDYYDFLHFNENEFGICIADVSGKGVSAALLMSNFQANMRALFTSEIALYELIQKLNERVISIAKGDKFITLFVAKYNFLKRELRYISAGHNPPLLYDSLNKIQYLDIGCQGVGMIDEFPLISEGKIIIPEGVNAKLLCFTDGLVELKSENEIASGLKAIENALSNESTIDEVIDDIVKSLNITRENETFFDDISILGIEFSK